METVPNPKDSEAPPLTPHAPNASPRSASSTATPGLSAVVRSRNGIGNSKSDLESSRSPRSMRDACKCHRPTQPPQAVAHSFSWRPPPGTPSGNLCGLPLHTLQLLGTSISGPFAVGWRAETSRKHPPCTTHSAHSPQNMEPQFSHLTAELRLESGPQRAGRHDPQKRRPHPLAQRRSSSSSS